jgi:Fe-S-cluster containining protein
MADPRHVRHWQISSGRLSPSTKVTPSSMGHFANDSDDGELDCLLCGVCCRTGQDGRILIPPEDLLRWHRIGRSDITEQIQPGHFGLDAFATREDGSCVHLGTEGQPNACQIYEDRGTTCRDFERGSAQCLEFRRDFGIG